MLLSWLRSRPAPQKQSSSRPTFQPALEPLSERIVPSATSGNGNPHLLADPSITFEDNTVTVEGSVAGLGNKDFTLTAEVDGEAIFNAYNPSENGKVVPGISAKISGSTSVSVDKYDIINGRYDFSIDVTLQVGELQLPNDQWTAVFVSASFDVTLTYVQDQGGATFALGTYHVEI